MKKFVVEFVEPVYYEVVVEAETQEEAEELAFDSAWSPYKTGTGSAEVTSSREACSYD